MEDEEDRLLILQKKRASYPTINDYLQDEKNRIEQLKNREGRAKEMNTAITVHFSKALRKGQGREGLRIKVDEYLENGGSIP